MKYKIEVIDILENVIFIGYTPFFQWGSKKKQGYTKGGKPLLFDTKRKARVFAMNQELYSKEDVNKSVIEALEVLKTLTDNEVIITSNHIDSMIKGYRRGIEPPLDWSNKIHVDIEP